MKKFIHNITVFGIILLLINIAIELLLFLRPNTYSYKRMYVEEHINDIRCLLLGNSHIEEALNPSILGNGVFNMAISGRYLVYDMELAKKYIPLMSQINTVIMPLDYTEFYFGREKDNPEEKKDPDNLESTYKCMYYKYMGLRVDELWYWSEILNSKDNFMMRFLKSDEESRECDSLGYIRLKLSNRKKNWQKRVLPKIIDTTLPIDKDKQERLYTQYCTLAELADKRGARLILLFTPMYNTYNNSTSPIVIEEMNAFVSHLKQKYRNVEYYDYSKDERFVNDDFKDASHLTENGAVKFSKIVKEEILDKH